LKILQIRNLYISLRKVLHVGFEGLRRLACLLREPIAVLLEFWIIPFASQDFWQSFERVRVLKAIMRLWKYGD